MSADALRIKGLRVRARLGVTEEERAAPREVRIDIDIECDLERAARSDELGDTVDYGRVLATVADAVEGGESKLLEHLAHRVASVVTGFEGVRRVTVEVSKSPPVEQEVEAVAVRIERDG